MIDLNKITEKEIQKVKREKIKILKEAKFDLLKTIKKFELLLESKDESICIFAAKMLSIMYNICFSEIHKYMDNPKELIVLLEKEYKENFTH
jgi:hypothetical protein